MGELATPGFPVAILENMTAFAAIKCGNALAEGNHGCDVAGARNRRCVRLGVVSRDAAGTIRRTVVSAARSGSRFRSPVFKRTVSRKRKSGYYKPSLCTESGLS